jgi:predicted nucleic acid-binding protein
MALNVLIDANRYRDFCEGEENTVALFRKVESIAVPFVVLADLRAGFACGKKTLENDKVLIRFLNKPRVHVLYPDEGTTHQYASLYRQLRSQGTPIPTNDIWIAALAIQHDLLLCTRDAHFQKLPQLPIVS